MGYSSEEIVEEILWEAFFLGKAELVMEKASTLIKEGVPKADAYQKAFDQICITNNSNGYG